MSYRDFAHLNRKDLSKLTSLKLFSQYFNIQRTHTPGEIQTPDDLKKIANAAELFGGLILASRAPASDKIDFLFDLADRDHDKRLNQVELEMALYSASLGLARLFKNPFPPQPKVRRSSPSFLLSLFVPLPLFPSPISRLVSSSPPILPYQVTLRTCTLRTCNPTCTMPTV